MKAFTVRSTGIAYYIDRRMWRRTAIVNRSPIRTLTANTQSHRDGGGVGAINRSVGTGAIVDVNLTRQYYPHHPRHFGHRWLLHFPSIFQGDNHATHQHSDGNAASRRQERPIRYVPYPPLDPGQ
jgi:hypothetical protein